MKRKTIYEIADSTTELGVTLPVNAIVQNIATKEVFSLNEKAASTDTLDSLNKTMLGGDSLVVGPASSTPNTVPVFADETGKLLKGTGVTIDEDNAISVNRTTYGDLAGDSTFMSLIQNRDNSSAYGTIKGIDSEITVNPSTNGGNNIRGIGSTVTYNGSGDVTGTVNSLRSYTYNTGTGRVANLYGFASTSSNTGGTFNKLVGNASNIRNTISDASNNDMYAYVTNAYNTGTCDQFYGLQVYMTNTGTVREYIGVQVDLQGVYSDTIGTVSEKMIGIDIGREHGWQGTALESYGIYIGSTVATQGTSKNYAIFSDTGADSYIKGNVGIGTNNPSEKLHVIGNTLASGDSASATKTIGGKVRMEYDTATDTLEFNFI